MAEHFSSKKVGDRFTTLRLAMFCMPTKPFQDYPRLKGRAGELKTASAAILEVCKQLFRRGNVLEAPRII